MIADRIQVPVAQWLLACLAIQEIEQLLCHFCQHSIFFLKNFLCQVLFFFFKGAEERWSCFVSSREGPESWGSCLTAALELSQDRERERRPADPQNVVLSPVSRLGEMGDVLVMQHLCHIFSRLRQFDINLTKRGQEPGVDWLDDKSRFGKVFRFKKTTGWWTSDGYVIFWTLSFIKSGAKGRYRFDSLMLSCSFYSPQRGTDNLVTSLFD